MKNKLMNIDNQLEDGIEAISAREDIYKIYSGFPDIIYNSTSLKLKLVIVGYRGVVAFSRNENEVDSVYFKLEDMFRKVEDLRERRNIVFKFEVLPWTHIVGNPGYISNFYDNFGEISLSSTICKIICNTIEVSLPTYNRTNATLNETINFIEKNIANFDRSQLESISTNTSKIQIISGLAGSGKTIVLARKVAQLLVESRNSKILVTFYSRSLKKEFEKLIRNFMKALSDDKLSLEERLDILSAWGNSSGDGVYSNTCNILGVKSLAYWNLKQFSDPFEYACRKLNELIRESSSQISLKIYDYILIDEAQDLGEQFLKLAYYRLKDSGQLIYAYDEFQDLSDRSMKKPEEIFTNVTSSQIKYTPLKICYRTPKQNLITAHSIGLGINSRFGICQFFRSKSEWELIGYKIESGGKANEETKIVREQPDYFKNINEKLVRHEKFISYNDMFQFIKDKVKYYLEQNIKLTDMMIVDMNKWEVQENYFKFKKLINDEFKIFLAGTSSSDVFWIDEHISYTNIYRAKGNEAYVVYIIDASHSMSSSMRTVWRNKLFTAITRSKLYVHLLSLDGNEANELDNELNIIVKNEHNLLFKYPTQKEILESKKIASKELESDKKLNEFAKTLFDFKDIDDIPIEEIRALLITKLGKEKFDTMFVLQKDKDNVKEK